VPQLPVPDFVAQDRQQLRQLDLLQQSVVQHDALVLWRECVKQQQRKIDG
jgi:hypothetical protein